MSQDSSRWPSPVARLFACAAALSAWLVLLFLGHPLRGATHLLLVAAILLFLRGPSRAGEPG